MLNLVACGATGGRTVNDSAWVLPEFFTHLDACLKTHGVADPETPARAVDVEHMIPALVGTEGIPVPKGVTPAQYESALRGCAVRNVRVGRIAITNPQVRREILSVRSCLVNNGFPMPAANFPGPGPVLDISAIDVGSARWVVTASGCSVNSSLTSVALSVCVSRNVLMGRATGPEFEDQLLGLPACLKRLSASAPQENATQQKRHSKPQVYRVPSESTLRSGSTVRVGSGSLAVGAIVV